MIESYDAAWNGRDSAAVASYLDPDYVYFSSTGRLTPRAQTLAFLTSPDYVLSAAERTDLEIAHASAAVAVVSSRWRGHGTWQGEAFRDDQRCSLVLGRRSEKWRILSEHCTQIPPQGEVSTALSLSEEGGSTMLYGLFGKMTTRPGQRDAVVAILLRDVQELKAIGCELYVVGVSQDHSDIVWVTELWASKEAHDKSLELPTVKQAIAEAMPMLTGEFEHVEFSVVGGLGVPEAEK